MPRNTIVTSDSFEGHELSPYKHTFDTKYLRRGIEMINSMERRHSKVLQVRMDFRYPQDMQSDGGNRNFQRTLQRLSRELTRKKCDPQYIAKREQETSSNPHLHLNLLVDGNRRRSAQGLIEIAEKHWGNTLGLTQEEVHQRQLVYPCNHDPDGNPRPNSYMLERRKMDDTKDKMIQQMSYLTKIRDADITPSRTRKFFISQFEKDESIAHEKREKWLRDHKKED